MYEVPAPSRMSGSSSRAMCSARAGISTAACARTFGRVASATTLSAESAAATPNTTRRLMSAMNPPIAGPTSIPAMLVDCM